MSKKKARAWCGSTVIDVLESSFRGSYSGPVKSDDQPRMSGQEHGPLDIYSALQYPRKGILNWLTAFLDRPQMPHHTLLLVPLRSCLMAARIGKRR